MPGPERHAAELCTVTGMGVGCRKLQAGKVSMAGRDMELRARRSCRGQETAVTGVWRGAHVLETAATRSCWCGHKRSHPQDCHVLLA